MYFIIQFELELGYDQNGKLFNRKSYQTQETAQPKKIAFTTIGYLLKVEKKNAIKKIYLINNRLHYLT